MALLHFESHAHVDLEDLVCMVRALRVLSAASPSMGWPPTATDSAVATLSWLLGSLRSARPAPPARASLMTAGAGASRSPLSALYSSRLTEPSPKALIDLDVERVLDHAAWLLDTADLLHRREFHSDAFALEGIQGRLLEAALGAGDMERAR